MVVDPGTSVYESGTQRDWERSTLAHNAVTVDNENQTEVWGAFRAGRRATPRIEQQSMEADRISLVASHDGYSRLPGRPNPRRSWLLERDALTVTDDIHGTGIHGVSARIALSPSTRVRLAEPGLVLNGELRVDLTLPRGLDWSLVNAADDEHAEVATGFGRRQPCQMIVITGELQLPTSFSVCYRVIDGR